MIRNVLGALARLFCVREPEPEPMPVTPVVPPLTLLRDEYESLPRGPTNVRRKRNSVKLLAAKHRMTTAELMAAVRRTQ